ncbi:hypothetical protein BGW38_001601 [Lunasporangiospora selenospora]|uniref:Ion transport domain-containing protein n=1 Tax=Lunasporangiospora selenospora TaxID=979761 RepID=A0A9P6FU42_9FUNG|nr:hypothetical protein BGW38_001601 [Lunasporangiospora selenospora]
MFYLTKFYINPFRHVYIRPNNYDLTILNNPAIEALIHYKWNTIGFKSWLIRFISKCIFYILIATAAAIQIYDPKPELQLGVFIAIAIFSGVFIWLEILQLKDHLKASTPRKKAKKKKGTSRNVSEVTKVIANPLRKKPTMLTVKPSSEVKKKGNQVTNMEGSREAQETGVIILESIGEEKNTGVNQKQEVAGVQEEDDGEDDDQDGSNVDRSGFLILRSQHDLLDYFVYFMAFGTSIRHIIVNGGEKRNSWDLSLCIIFVFLHMLSELRVSEIVCKYVTIVFDILNEIKVFLIVLVVGILSFSLAILHAGGRYDALSKNLMDENGEYLNWPLQALLLTYFFFAVIVMLNVLIALVNAAYSKSNNNWRQVSEPAMIIFQIESFTQPHHSKSRAVSSSSETSTPAGQELNRDHLETIEKMQAYLDQRHSDEKEVSKMRTDMTRLNEGMTGLESEVKDTKCGLTGLQDEMKAILAALVTLQQSQIQKE